MHSVSADLVWLIRAVIILLGKDDDHLSSAV